LSVLLLRRFEREERRIERSFLRDWEISDLYVVLGSMSLRVKEWMAASSIAP